jgi:hypothetical protein
MWSVPIIFGESENIGKAEYRSRFDDQAELITEGLHKFDMLCTTGGRETWHSPINVCH